jgi:hypothetical protein
VRETVTVFVLVYRSGPMVGESFACYAKLANAEHEKRHFERAAPSLELEIVACSGAWDRPERAPVTSPEAM